MFEVSHQLEIQQCKYVLSVFSQCLLWASSAPFLTDTHREDFDPPLVFGVDSSYHSTYPSGLSA